MSREDESTDQDSGVNPAFKWALVVFPAGIFILGFVSIVYYLNGGFDPREELVRSEREVGAKRITGVIESLELYSPERGFDSEEERLGLRRVLKMYESSLGERNAGYEVLVTKGFPVEGELWPLLAIEIPPKEADAGYQVMALAATQPAATHATALAVLESIASNREAETGLLFLLFPVAAGAGYDEQQKALLAEFLKNRELQQIVVLEDLGSSPRLAYSGKIRGASDWLAPGMIESGSLAPAANFWQNLFSETPVLVLGARASDERLDPVAQADLARELEAMVRRLTGL